VAIPWARPIFKYGVALCAAFPAGQLLYYLLFGNYVGSNKLFLPGMLGCITVAGLLGFFAAEMLLKKRFNVFRSSLGGAIAVVSTLVIIGVGMSFDPTGYETYTPDAEDVEYVYVSFYSDGVDFYEEVYDKETIEALITAHKAVIAEKDKMLSYRDGNYGHVNDDLFDDSYFHFSVRYYLDNDREVRRQYNGGHILREELADPTSFASAITEFINMPEASYTRTLGRNFSRAGEVGSTITGGRVHGWYGTQTYNGLSNELTAAQAREVYATLQLDMEIGNNRKTSVFYSKENDRYVDLELWYNYTEEAISDIKYVTDTTVAISEQGNASLHLTVRKEMKNTVALLKSFGYLPEGF
jgi:ABC-2 type transport system permease protein